jgi:hypothetical protein
MAITITWGTKVINVPRADMTLIQASPEIRELDLDDFRLALKDLEDSEEGMCFPDTHTHNAGVTVGGTTLAMVIEIINGYTITFEDGQYAVNLVGANSNVADVTNVNQVSIRSQNSAGLIGSAVLDLIPDIEETVDFNRKVLSNRLELEAGSTENWILYDDDNITIIKKWNITDLTGGDITTPAGVPTKRMPV